MNDLLKGAFVVMLLSFMTACGGNKKAKAKRININDLTQSWILDTLTTKKYLKREKDNINDIFREWYKTNNKLFNSFAIVSDSMTIDFSTLLAQERLNNKNKKYPADTLQLLKSRGAMEGNYSRLLEFDRLNVRMKANGTFGGWQIKANTLMLYDGTMNSLGDFAREAGKGYKVNIIKVTSRVLMLEDKGKRVYFISKAIVDKEAEAIRKEKERQIEQQAEAEMEAIVTKVKNAGVDKLTDEEIRELWGSTRYKVKVIKLKDGSYEKLAKKYKANVKGLREKLPKTWVLDEVATKKHLNERTKSINEIFKEWYTADPQLFGEFAIVGNTVNLTLEKPKSNSPIGGEYFLTKFSYTKSEKNDAPKLVSTEGTWD